MRGSITSWGARVALVPGFVGVINPSCFIFVTPCVMEWSPLVGPDFFVCAR